MAKKKIWAKGGGVTKNFDNGGSVLNVYIDIDDAMERGFVRKSKQGGKNILSFIMSERQEPSEYGDTHSLYRLATPEEEAADGGSAKTAYKTPQATAYKPANTS